MLFDLIECLLKLLFLRRRVAIGQDVGVWEHLAVLFALNVDALAVGALVVHLDLRWGLFQSCLLLGQGRGAWHDNPAWAALVDIQADRWRFHASILHIGKSRHTSVSVVTSVDVWIQRNAASSHIFKVFLLMILLILIYVWFFIGISTVIDLVSSTSSRWASSFET